MGEIESHLTRGVGIFGFVCVGMCERNLLGIIIVLGARDIVDGIGADAVLGQTVMQGARE